ncbi:MAG: L-serine ammonia-lyase, iron-sulfur-dependent, subunit beta, partial [Streptococcaceae bacterium]|nr:L-serine ammonia-lyase, iron-sulfur-dependent, subunit beta [Streptococcaceae bacterium]
EKGIMICEVDTSDVEEAYEEMKKIPQLHDVNFFK